ncbi:DNA polymerase [Streptomyces ardesiacus]|uniref:DNA polymerase n=1 Tax=Streptomyces ardesiacus TaxID=285564 RepID=UPI00365CECC8
MRTYRHAVAGDNVTVFVPETPGDLVHFKDWWVHSNGDVALDTETTGLDVFSDGHRLRTVQFGDRNTAWVIHWERGGRFVEAVVEFFRRWRRRLYIHNAPYDWMVLCRHAGLRLEYLVGRTRDTQVMAKLVDPRQPQEGGIGASLKPLSAFYIDPTAPDTQGDLTAVFRSLGLTKATGWAGIPLDHPTYNLYAGLDVILTARLYPKLEEALSTVGVRQVLVDYEHELLHICAEMTRKGMVLDREYAETLSGKLTEVEDRYLAVAQRYGVTSVNAPKQIAEALLGMGEDLILPGATAPEMTPSGAYKLDKNVLFYLADLDVKDGTRANVRKPNPLAEAVIRSKRAGKWRKTYADTFLETVDPDGRVHPVINSLQARTGRMSVTRPALQTLPSSDQMIRRALLAEEGGVMISTDFAAIEMRVLAALADVKQMKRAILAGEDLHEYTARLVFGDDFTPKHRKLCKGVGFGKVYGGGATTIARQTGAPMEDVQRAIRAYDRVYPEIKRASARWQREAYANRMVTVSATGRQLPLDRDRAYAVVNYQCQSAARDCLGQALIDMKERGLMEYLRLPIHDEVLASAPKEDAEDVARAIKECMTFDLFGVPVAADAEIGKRSWGSLYGADV